MTPVRYLPSAENDLSEILLTIAQDHPPAAIKFNNILRTAILRLAEHPLSAPKRLGVGAGMRGLSVGRYVVFYRVTPAEVLIIRIIHTARDIDASYFPDP
jgi:toxin ParE1/3/4